MSAGPAPAGDVDTAAAVDSQLLGNLYAAPAMRQVWGDRSRVARMLEVERALAVAQGGLGLIPVEAASAIARACSLEHVDLAALRRATERSGYPVLGLVAQVAAACDDGHGAYVHWGATTQDIVDSACVLQMREALAWIGHELAAISAALAALARTHRDTLMIGRTALQQAVPVTFGLKAAGWLAAVERHRERLLQLEPRVLVLQLGGAAGTLATMGSHGVAVQAAVAAELGLGAPLMPWHTQRDGIAEVGALLALVGGTLGKVALDVELLMQTEVAEASEPAADGRGTSSTMPQKRNPVLSSYVRACTAMLRQHAAALLDAMVAEHERAAGAWQLEWIALPEAFCLCSGALQHVRTIVEGLEVDPAAMRRNLDLTGGLVMSEAVTMGLGAALGRDRAHHLVQGLCRQAVEAGRPLLDVLLAAPEVVAHLDREHLERLLDPAGYLGVAGETVDRVLAARR